MSFNAKPYDKVNWMHAQTLDNGFKAAVSEKSGIVKLTFPNSYHTIMLFKDQLDMLNIQDLDVRRYFEAHDSSIKSSTEGRESRKMNTAQQKLVKAIVDNPALNAEQKQAMIAMLSKAA